jgi:hypothetical protein
MDRWSLEFICQYVLDIIDEFSDNYSIFKDKTMGPIRQRAGELHTAVIDLAARLSKSGIDKTWFPAHTFIVLSQIQNHSAAILEDLDVEDEPPENELDMIDTTLDSMIDTYEGARELIDDALSSFRNTNFTLIKANGASNETWYTIQLSLGGTDIWRRVLLPSSFLLSELQRTIHKVLSWSGFIKSRFTTDYKMITGVTGDDRTINLKQTLEFLADKGLAEFLYEYGPNWTVKIIILSKQDGAADDHVCCIAGEGAPPNEKIEGPLRYRRLLSNLENGAKVEHETAMLFGKDFDSARFSIHECNHALKKLFGK